MKYRIIKKHWRSDDTAEIKSDYYIEYLDCKYLWSRKKTWIKYTIRVCYYDCYDMVKIFDKLSEARKYLKNLQKPIPKNLIKTLK